VIGAAAAVSAVALLALASRGAGAPYKGG
jgi:hypothetical protein